MKYNIDKFYKDDNVYAYTYDKLSHRYTYNGDDKAILVSKNSAEYSIKYQDGNISQPWHEKVLNQLYKISVYWEAMLFPASMYYHKVGDSVIGTTIVARKEKWYGPQMFNEFKNGVAIYVFVEEDDQIWVRYAPLKYKSIFNKGNNNE